MRQKKEFPPADNIEPDQVGDDFQQATAFHLRGQLGDAERLYRKVLNAMPDHFDALHLLGVLEAQKKNNTAAAALISKALEINPRDAAAHSNLANVLLSLVHYEEALHSCDRALALNPDLADAYNNRGVALHGLRLFEDSLASFDRALDRRPDFPEALNARASALLGLGRCEEALASCDRALALSPDFPSAHNNRGVVLRELDRLEEALASCDRALALSPDFADAHSNRGVILRCLKRFEQALDSTNRALALNPALPEALDNRGNLLQDLHRYEEAAESYEKLMDVAPDDRYAAGKLLWSKCCACSWNGYEAVRQSVVRGVEEEKVSVDPFSFLAVSHSPAEQLKCAQAHVRSKHPPSANPLWRGEVYRHDRIRLAYVSADFHVHPTALLMIGLFERHDRSRFETIAISYGPNRPGPLRARLESAFDRFIDVRGKSALEIARLMRELEVDIAIECNGFTKGGLPDIFGFRPVPVQAQYLGYPGTMGGGCIDYILADRLVIPEDHQKYYAEKVVYLPDSYQVNDSNRFISLRIPDRAESGLPEVGFVFCCFNQHFKITPQIFDIWMRLLEDVNDSVLWLIDDNKGSVANLRSEAANRGVAPERLVFAPRIEQAQHLARHRLANVFIDTLPYNAHTTASDALWTGLPVVTCTGNAFAGRVAASLLNAIGLPELATPNLDAYEDLLRTLATNPAKLGEIKAKVRQNRTTHPLFDTDRFRHHIEQAYITMWERYQGGKSPEGFPVSVLV